MQLRVYDFESEKTWLARGRRFTNEIHNRSAKHTNLPYKTRYNMLSASKFNVTHVTRLASADEATMTHISVTHVSITNTL